MHVLSVGMRYKTQALNIAKKRTSIQKIYTKLCRSISQKRIAVTYDSLPANDSIVILLLKGNVEYIVPNYKPFALFANFSDRYVDEVEDKQLFNLLEAMLNPSPHSRIDINAVLSHPWLKNQFKECLQLKH